MSVVVYVEVESLRRLRHGFVGNAEFEVLVPNGIGRGRLNRCLTQFLIDRWAKVNFHIWVR